MKCSLIAQFVVLVGLGLGAGFIHAKLSPVKTTVDKPVGIEDAMQGAKARPVVGAKGAEPEKPAGAGDTGKPSGTDKPSEKPVEKPVEQPGAAPAGPSAPSSTAGSGAAGAAEESLTQAQRDKGHITLKEAHTLFTSNTAYFVDTRKKADYEEGHVKEAFGIPLGAFHGKTPKLVDLIDRESPVVVYCIGGNCDESDEVAKNFNLMGYKKVYVMHAGFPGWKAAGYPVETGAGIQEAE